MRSCRCSRSRRWPPASWSALLKSLSINCSLSVIVSVERLKKSKFTDANADLARDIQNSFDSPLKEKLLDSSIYMYKRLSIPGVLIECGFLSNDKERKLLQDGEYQDKLVKSIVKGLIKYY